MSDNDDQRNDDERNDERRDEDAARGVTDAEAGSVASDVSTSEQVHRAERRPTSRRRRRLMVTGGVGLAVLIGVAAGGLPSLVSSGNSSSSSTSSEETVDAFGATRSAPYAGRYPGYGAGAGTTSGSAVETTDAVPASAAQTSGVVTILSTLGYEGAQSAGTGIVLTSDGMILTNNHVVEGSTSIEVTVEATGATYTATVVGTDATDDIAVLQLADASGLQPAALDTQGAAVGDSVTAIGNAEGTGDLVAASGTVTATDQTITTQSETGVEGETLSGLIQIQADIVSGDSGGPLVDDQGEVLGIDTAASTGSAAITGFAIPISTALDIVAQIEAGADTENIEIGYSGFLGVGLADGSAYGSTYGSTVAGATIAGVYEDTPAANAGLAAGDVVTSVDGVAVGSAAELSAALSGREPGESVALTWTDAAGATRSASVTLIAGPVA